MEPGLDTDNEILQGTKLKPQRECDSVGKRAEAKARMRFYREQGRKLQRECDSIGNRP